MARVKAGLTCAFVALLILGVTGCDHTQVGTGGTPEQRDLMQAFLAAHDKNDLEAEEYLVDWDNVTEGYKNFFIKNHLERGLKHRILSIDIVDLPNVGPSAFQGYNIQPEKFLAIQYDGDMQDKRSLYPIGQTSGRYYLAMQSGK